jgi:hypothetical protein
MSKQRKRQGMRLVGALWKEYISQRQDVTTAKGYHSPL